MVTSMAERLALIIDDSPTALAVLSRMLKRLQVAVDTVLSGEEALLYLEKHKPDIIFLDHIMPGMDGFEALRAIKENGQTQGIPVVMYTSQKERKYAEEAKHLGAVDVISKQVTGGLLSRVLDHVWRGGQATNDAYAPTAGSIESLDDVVNQVNRSQVAAEAEEGERRSAKGHPIDHLLKHYLEEQRKEILASNNEIFNRLSSANSVDEPRRPAHSRSSLLLILFLVISSIASTTIAVSVYQQMDRRKRDIHRTLIKIERDNRRIAQAVIGKIGTIETQYKETLKDQASLIAIIDRLSHDASASVPIVDEDVVLDLIDDIEQDLESERQSEQLDTEEVIPESETFPDDTVDNINSVIEVNR